MAKHKKEYSVYTKEGYTICPSCGNFAHSAQQQSYCIVCGEKMIAQCVKCHEPILYPTARFCPACGMSYGKNADQNVITDVSSGATRRAAL